MADDNMKKKRGQVTMFIILGIIIVSVILVYFLWVRPTYTGAKSAEIGFESCIKDVIEQSIDELEKKGGFINPEFYHTYKDEKFPYLCYTDEYYQTCTVQVPFIKNSFDKQLEIFSKEKISKCYDDSLESLRAQGYSVSRGEIIYDILIEPGTVRVELEAPTTVGTQGFTKFNVKISSPIYEMLMISTSIIQFEAKYGDADTSSIMIYYPDYIVDKIKLSDGVTLYILENKITKNKFQFASKSLVWPAGYAFQ